MQCSFCKNHIDESHLNYMYAGRNTQDALVMDSIGQCLFIIKHNK